MDIIVRCEIIVGHTCETQEAHTINIKDCREKDYDGASTIASKTKGTFSVINRKQPYCQILLSLLHAKPIISSWKASIQLVTLPQIYLRGKIFFNNLSTLTSII